MLQQKVAAAQAEVDALLTKRLLAKGNTFAQKLANVANKLPKGVSEPAQYLLEAEVLGRHPKFRVQVNAQRVAQARKTCVRELAKVNQSRDWSRIFTMTLGVIVINLALFAAGFYAVLVWLGAI
jgi:hypothetical protein